MDKLKMMAVSALHWLERYTKTDMLYLAKGGFWLGLGQFVSSGAAFLTSIAFANLLAPEVFGVYKYILSINSLLLITTLAGMDSAVTQSVARGFEGTLAVGVRTKMKWGLIGSIASLGIALYYFYQGNMMLTVAFSITAVFVPLTESFDMFNSLLWGKKLFDVQTKYNVTKKIIALVAMISAIYFTKNLYWILAVYFLSIVIPNVYFLYKTKKNYLDNNNVDPESMKYGKNLSGIYVIALLLAELDKILVFHFVGAVDLAVYSLALAPTDQIKGLLKNVNSLAMPQFSQRTPKEIKKTIWHKVWILGLGVTSIVAVYVLLAPIFFKLFFPKYLASIHFSQIMAISLIPIILAGFIYTVLESQKAQKQLYQYNVYSSALNIVILFPLIYYFGIWGAVFSRLITRIFTFFLSAMLINRIN
jgi:O-antigen/teichoic acid export membrane protein